VAGVVAVLILGVGYSCPIKLVAGVPCPTCGITRACRLVLRGDFGGATRMHPLVWLAVPVVALLLGVELVGYARTHTWGASRRLRGADALMVTTAALLFALWIARFAGYFGGPVE
jgi:hypothetical protein